jgi:hypothetical protein
VIQDRAIRLSQQLADELAAAAFDNFEKARNAINNDGIRLRYLNQLAACTGLTEPLRYNVAADINRQCDELIRRLAPIQCAKTGWSQYTRPAS